MQAIQEKPTMSVKEMCKFLGVSIPIGYAITEREDFQALIRIGRKKLILKSRLMEWLEQQAGKPGR